MEKSENKVSIIEPKEFGIEKEKANELMGSLPQIIEERKPLTSQFDKVIKMDIDNPETTKIAKELRMLIKKNRTQGILAWHKTTKDYFLKGGQFVDAIKRKEAEVNERMESDLEAIEKHAEIKEQKRLEGVQNKRVEILSKYVDDAGERDLSSMDDDVWNAYITSKKKEHEDRIEAEKQEELEKREIVRLDELENQRMMETAQYTSFMQEDYDFREMSEKEYAEVMSLLKLKSDEYNKKQEDIRKENERLQEERKEREDKEQKKQEEYEAKINKERKDKEKIQAELQAKKDEEIAEENRIKELNLTKENASDKEKLENFINDLNIEFPSCKSKKSQEVAKEIKNKFESFKSWANNQIKSI